MANEIIQIEEELHVSKYIIAYKFALGVVELLLALGIIFFGRQAFAIYQNFKNQELLGDPNDLLLNITEKIVPYLTTHIRIITIILILLGFVKIVGAIALVYKKHWGLDLLIILTIFLLPFQAFDLLQHPTLAKIMFFALDSFVALYLVQFEPRKYFLKMYGRIRKKPHVF